MREAAGYVMLVVMALLAISGAAYLWYNSAGQRFRRHELRAKARRRNQHATGDDALE